MKGYKVFNNDWTCQGYQYEVGQTYEMPQKPKLCERGFHFCLELQDCFKYYDAVQWNKIAEVEALGEIDGPESDCSKVATNKIKVVREIDWAEIPKVIKDGVNWSDGVNGSNGVNWSYGVNGSDGVNGSYGILNSFGVDNTLFLADKPRTYSIFGKEVTENRFIEVKDKLFNLLGDWKPTFNNLKSLYLKSGGKWARTPIPNAKELSIKEAWEGMSQKAIEYIKSLPEYDAEIFKKITGIGE